MENFSSECGREKSEYGPKNKTKISLSLSNISSSFPGKKSPRVHSLSADSNESSCWCTERTRRNNGFWLVPNDVIPFSITQVPFYTFHYAKVESRKDGLDKIFPHVPDTDEEEARARFPWLVMNDVIQIRKPMTLQGAISTLLTRSRS